MVQVSNDIEDVIMWPDDSWCYRYELEEFQQGRSDDYRVIPYDSEEWHAVTA